MQAQEPTEKSPVIETTSQEDDDNNDGHARRNALTQADPEQTKCIFGDGAPSEGVKNDLDREKRIRQMIKREESEGVAENEHQKFPNGIEFETFGKDRTQEMKPRDGTENERCEEPVGQQDDVMPELCWPARTKQSMEEDARKTDKLWMRLHASEERSKLHHVNGRKASVMVSDIFKEESGEEVKKAKKPKLEKSDLSDDEETDVSDCATKTARKAKKPKLEKSDLSGQD